jgi:hypothetical protein
MRTKILAIAALLLTAAQAHAIPQMTIYPYQARQAGSSSVNVGLIVSAATAWHTISVAGGWTVRCAFTSLELNAQQEASNFALLGGASATVYVPSVVPSAYTLPGWSSLPTGSCGHCTHYYKGSARDGSARISFGAGVNFQLTLGGEPNIANTSTFEFCRGGRPQCCTDGCSLD